MPLKSQMSPSNLKFLKLLALEWLEPAVSRSPPFSTIRAQVSERSNTYGLNNMYIEYTTKEVIP